MSVPERFPAEGSVLIVVDVQGKLFDGVVDRTDVLGRIVQTTRAARVLQIPVVATEQYPKGLGPSVPEVAELVPVRGEKLAFGGADCPVVREALAGPPPWRATLVGIEAHVCIAQTALQLLAKGCAVQVAADAVSSRRAFDRDVALRRLERAGVVVTTAEAAIFEWVGTAAHPDFRAISALIKEADRARAPSA